MDYTRFRIQMRYRLLHPIAAALEEPGLGQALASQGMLQGSDHECGFLEAMKMVGTAAGSRCLTQARTGLTSASTLVHPCVDISLGIAGVQSLVHLQLPAYILDGGGAGLVRIQVLIGHRVPFILFGV